MRQTSLMTLLLGFVLFCWISLPNTISDRVRSTTVAVFSNLWKSSEAKIDETTFLQAEIQNLRTQLELIYDWVSQEKLSYLKNKTSNQWLTFPAQVIYRDPAFWSSSLWVNVGEDDNQSLGKTVIAKNSPVILGNSLVGVIDHVGKKQSRVRLITDSGVSPSVRAVRGGVQNRELAQFIHNIVSRLEAREEIFNSEKEKTESLALLSRLALKLGQGSEEGYLAKGELRGSSAPFWRSRGQILKGTGFNYDYPDENGPARDLRTGKVLEGGSIAAVPILKQGDLLVTSGLDGVFPPGLFVGSVIHVNPLKEGAYFYDLEARPCAPNLADLQTLFILPPVNSD